MRARARRLTSGVSSERGGQRHFWSQMVLAALRVHYSGQRELTGRCAAVRQAAIFEIVQVQARADT